MNVILHYVAWLYQHGLYDQAVKALQFLLALEHHHPGAVDRIHRFMYRLNPDWGL